MTITSGKVRLLCSTVSSLLLLLNHMTATGSAQGYSYTNFVGPVVAPEQQVVVHDAVTGRASMDYLARPKYEFSYGVHDTKSRVMHDRHETRNGDNVQGVYSLIEPDGSLRVVNYKADNLNGFQAVVQRDENHADNKRLNFEPAYQQAPNSQSYLPYHVETYHTQTQQVPDEDNEEYDEDIEDSDESRAGKRTINGIKAISSEEDYSSQETDSSD